MKKPSKRKASYSMRQAWVKESKEIRGHGFLSKSDLEICQIWFEAGFCAAIDMIKQREVLPRKRR
jgi:hypothetical protein